MNGHAKYREDSEETNVNVDPKHNKLTMTWLVAAAVMLGGDEIAAGNVTIKDLDLGRALAAKVTDNQTWRGERPGQATIRRTELVAFVRRIIEG